MTKRLFLPTLVLALLAVSCATGPPEHDPAVTDAPVTRLPQRLPEPKYEVLDGRHICIDPGHGGPWPGAISPSNGLREADVNLRVSLHLADILRRAGATVSLTRTADMALDSSSLSADLAARAAFANASGADIFLSVHHNADIVDGSEKDDLEVYYALRDDGPSLDLGQSLVYAIGTRYRLDTSDKYLLPGNYKVLRESELPAVLLETAYLTHAPSAARLSTSAGVRGEAQAIAAGLAYYFELDPPALGEPVLSADPFSIEVPVVRGGPIDFSSIHVTAADRPFSGQAEKIPGGFRYQLHQPLPNGDLPLTVSARNGAGATGRISTRVHANRDPHFMNINQETAAPRNSEYHVAFKVHLADRFGEEVRDGTVVRFATLDIERTTTDGVARFYVAAAKLPEIATFHAGQLSETVFTHRSTDKLASLQILDQKTDKPLPNALVQTDTENLLTNRDGYVSVQDALGSATISAKGYLTIQLDVTPGHVVVALEPLYSGALHGQTIVLDPLDGGRRAGAIGPGGLRSSDFALDICRRLAQEIDSAGGQAILLRESDSEISELTRVARSDAVYADIHISVTFGIGGNRARLINTSGYQVPPPAAFAAHYPGSSLGQHLAARFSQHLTLPSTYSTVYYPIQQVAAPAVLVQPQDITNPETELELRSAAHRQTIANDMFEAVLSYFREHGAP